MASRGRGRGGYGGGFGGGYGGTPEPFILFPENVVLPDINDVKEETALVVANNKLQIYWKSSPYYLEKPTKKSEENDIERYFDGNKPSSRAKRLPLAHFLKLEDKYFPAELFLGKKKVEYNQSKGFSHQNKDKLNDILENLERKYKDQETKGENEKKKENENESDNDQDEIEEESSDTSEDDYDKFDKPDDDDDDYNMEEDGNPDDDNVY